MRQGGETMPAYIPLCILSSIAFCACARGLIAVATGNATVAWRAKAMGFSPRSMRVARLYLSMALSVLMTAAFVGMVRGFFELFSAQF
jgi:hypothetical protein